MFLKEALLYAYCTFVALPEYVLLRAQADLDVWLKEVLVYAYVTYVVLPQHALQPI
jgi:hypothetical protein